MAGVRVHVEFVGFAMLFECLLVEVHLFRGGATVFLAKEAEEGTGEVGGVVDGGHGIGGGEVFGGHDDAAAPAVDGGVAVVGEFAGGFVVPFIPAGGVMDDDHGREGAEGAGKVGVDDFTLEPGGCAPSACYPLPAKRQRITPAFQSPTGDLNGSKVSRIETSSSGRLQTRC